MLVDFDIFALNTVYLEYEKPESFAYSLKGSSSAIRSSLFWPSSLQQRPRLVVTSKGSFGLSFCCDGIRDGS